MSKLRSVLISIQVGYRNHNYKAGQELAIYFIFFFFFSDYMRPSGSLKRDAGSQGQGPPVCCGLQLTRSSSSHHCAALEPLAFFLLAPANHANCAKAAGGTSQLHGMPGRGARVQPSPPTQAVKTEGGVSMSLSWPSYQLLQGEAQLSQAASPTRPYWVFGPPWQNMPSSNYIHTWMDPWDIITICCPEVFIRCPSVICST